jgi:hypothetical protein
VSRTENRTHDLDRLYGLLVHLCEDVRYPEPGQDYALMDAFNLVAELHTPTALVADKEPSVQDGFDQAVDQTEALAAGGDSMHEILRLRLAHSLLLAARKKWLRPTGARR